MEQYKYFEETKVAGKIWYNKEHKIHNIDGPAVTRTSGRKIYYISGKAYYDFLSYIREVIKYKSNQK